MADVLLPHVQHPLAPAAAPIPASAPVPPPAPSAIESGRAKPFLRVALEVLLISAGVFLGLAGDQWRENAEHRRLARATMERFRAEITANRESIIAVHEYRVTMLGQLRAYLGAPHNVRNTADVKLRGLRSTHFEETAWELALATQSLTYLDDELAAKLSRVYTTQHRIADLTRGIFQAMYLIDARENFDGLASAVEIYFADMVIMEPALLRTYDDVLAELSKHLGDDVAVAEAK